MLEKEHHQLQVEEVEAEGDHQLEGGEEEEEEAEAGEEGLLLCSMCTTEHCLGYVIISGSLPVYVLAMYVTWTCPFACVTIFWYA